MLGDADRHFWITRSVARAMGLNLSAVMREGRLTADGYAGMVDRCRACGQADRCTLWLGAQLRRAPRPPEGCPLSDELLRLRPH